MKEPKGLKLTDLTQVGDEYSFIRVDIPNPDYLVGGAQGAIFLRWNATQGELNIEVADFAEPLKSNMKLVSYTKGEVVLKLEGLE